MGGAGGRVAFGADFLYALVSMSRNAIVVTIGTGIAEEVHVVIFVPYHIRFAMTTGSSPSTNKISQSVCVDCHVPSCPALPFDLCAHLSHS